MRKSYFAGFVLTIMFGPFGLLYASGPVAIVIILSWMIMIAGTGTDDAGMLLSMIFFWPPSILLSGYLVGRWNRRVTRTDLD